MVGLIKEVSLKHWKVTCKTSGKCSTLTELRYMFHYEIGSGLLLSNLFSLLIHLIYCQDNLLEWYFSSSSYFIYLSVYLSIYLLFCLSIYLFICYVVSFNALEFVLSVLACFIVKQCNMMERSHADLSLIPGSIWLWDLSFTEPPCFIWNSRDNTYFTRRNESLSNTYVGLFPTPLRCESFALVTSILCTSCLP